jgi:hypothetical protein
MKITANKKAKLPDSVASPLYVPSAVKRKERHTKWQNSQVPGVTLRFLGFGSLRESAKIPVVRVEGNL